MIRGISIFLALVICQASVLAQRPRLAVLTDIGGDPDDQQSLVRLLVYANEFEIEAIVASAAGTRGELKTALTRTDLVSETIAAYEKVLPNLRSNAEGYPDAAELQAVVKSGNPHRTREFIGERHDTEGSHWLRKCIDEGSPEQPLNICVWGGQTDLAQTLWRIKFDTGHLGLAAAVSKFRVYDINDQDGIADWMRDEFPGMHYVLAQAAEGRDKREGTYRGMYLTGDETLTSRQWVQQNVLEKGPLGAMYPTQTWTAPNPHGCLKEGDTPSWFFFLPLGHNDPANPRQAGWGGEFQQGLGGWWYDAERTNSHDPRTSVSRWRAEYQADFARRMNWCVAK